MKRSKIIILDIDGTVIDSPSVLEPTREVIEAVKNVSEEYLVCLATGRTWEWTEPVVKVLGLNDPIVCTAGTEIRDAKGSILWQVKIDEAPLEQIFDVLEKTKDVKYLANDYSLEDYLEGGDLTLGDLRKIDEVRLIERAVVTHEEADVLIAELNSIDGVAAVKAMSYKGKNKYSDVHIMSSFATKEHAVTELLKITQIDVDETIAVGDGHNDLHLFASVKTKVAMGNAVQELKDAADVVVGSVEDNGLADYLGTLKPSS